MAKLQYKVLNKGIELESKLMEQLAEYDEKVIDAMTVELERLEAEYDALKLKGNVRTDFNMEEYLANQRRLKELPTLISDLQRDRLKAIDDKSKLKDSLCKGIYADVGEEIREEFKSNMDILQSGLDEALTEVIKIYKQMRELDNSYNDAISNVIATSGIYLTMAHEPYFNKVLSEHGLNQKSFNLYYAK